MWAIEIVTTMAGFISGYCKQRKIPLLLVFIFSFIVFGISFFIIVITLPEKAEWVDLSSIVLGSLIFGLFTAICVVIGVKYGK